MSLNPITFFRNKYYRNAEMVSYWKKNDSVVAKQMRMPDGSYAMQMKGEKYLFPGYPRGALLFGGLSKLKHEIKNQVFNESWRMLAEGMSDWQVLNYLNTVAWPSIFKEADKVKYDMVPYERLNPPVKELHRAMTASGCNDKLRDIVCFILQEDDAYRWRFQWLTKFFPWLKKPTIADWLTACTMAEEAEIVGDMKERQRLFRKVCMLMARNSPVFKAFLKECNWSKLMLTKADKYFFRAKYFKVDYPEYQY